MSDARAMPESVLELLQGEIERRNEALNRWNKKLRAAATLSGVPEDAEFQFSTNADGTAVFTTVQQDQEKTDE